MTQDESAIVNRHNAAAATPSPRPVDLPAFGDVYSPNAFVENTPVLASWDGANHDPDDLIATALLAEIDWMGAQVSQ